MERCVARDVSLDLRVERQSEVEVQSLEVPGLPAVERREDKVTDDRQRRQTLLEPADLDQLPRHVERPVARPERPVDLREPTRAQLLRIVARPHAGSRSQKTKPSRSTTSPVSHMIGSVKIGPAWTKV